MYTTILKFIYIYIILFSNKLYKAHTFENHTNFGLIIQTLKEKLPKN